MKIEKYGVSEAGSFRPMQIAEAIRERTKAEPIPKIRPIPQLFIRLDMQLVGSFVIFLLLESLFVLLISIIPFICVLV